MRAIRTAPEREVPVTEKRKGPGPRPVAPDDPAAHARGLKARVEDALQQTDSDLGGFDDRRLFRFDVAKGFNPDEIGRLSADIELVSQEADTVVVAFVSRAALASFEARLASMAQGDAVSYKQVIYALQGIAGWSAEDRTGWALRREGMPAAEPFLLDLELWPVDARPAERTPLGCLSGLAGRQRDRDPGWRPPARAAAATCSLYPRPGRTTAPSSRRSDR